MKIQRRKANFVPFRRTRGGVEVYLSQRSKIAKQFPNMWSFWGGGIEGEESPERVMLREIEEELAYNSGSYKFLGIYYDTAPNEKHIFYAEVGDDFENEIEIKEGQGGKFFSRTGIAALPNLLPGDEAALKDLFVILEGR